MLLKWMAQLVVLTEEGFQVKLALLQLSHTAIFEVQSAEAEQPLTHKAIAI